MEDRKFAKDVTDIKYLRACRFLLDPNTWLVEGKIHQSAKNVLSDLGSYGLKSIMISSSLTQDIISQKYKELENLKLSDPKDVHQAALRVFLETVEFVLVSNSGMNQIKGRVYALFHDLQKQLQE